MKQGLSLRVSQHLALTPQLQQSIRLLQLSTLELGQEVEQMLDENPFLERVEDSTAEREEFGVEYANTPVNLAEQTADIEASKNTANKDEYLSVSTDDGSTYSTDAATLDDDGLSTSPDWDGDGSVESSPDDGEWGGEAPVRQQNGGADEETASAAELAHEHVTLQAHLHQQALGLRLIPDIQAALFVLIESLNEDGYLTDSLAELAAQFVPGDLQLNPEIAVHRQGIEASLRAALPYLQEMEPAGVGARNLAECLKLQIEELRNTPQARAALCICRQPLELLAKRDVRKLAVLCATDEETVRAALALITKLEPKPGRRFTDAERHVIVPDVIVVRVGRGFKVQLNPDVMPRLRIHDVYAGALREGRSAKGDNGTGMQQCLQEARWFIKNIQQRFDTILRVSSAIVERQRNFFMHGELAMRPLVLREIADELGLHESTISRVTTAKYMATPFGTYELKYFFGSSLGTEMGGNASSTAVRALIKQLVASEDSKKPLSDNSLSDLLREQGIECARRTVAKYREALKIAPASLRKSL
jgi:RNA polymerase sigma-54 factor